MRIYDIVAIQIFILFIGFTSIITSLELITKFENGLYNNFLAVSILIFSITLAYLNIRISFLLKNMEVFK